MSASALQQSELPVQLGPCGWIQSATIRALSCQDITDVIFSNFLPISVLSLLTGFGLDDELREPDQIMSRWTLVQAARVFKSMSHAALSALWRGLYGLTHLFNILPQFKFSRRMEDGDPVCLSRAVHAIDLSLILTYNLCFHIGRPWRTDPTRLG